MINTLLVLLADAYTPLVALALSYYLYASYKKSKKLFNQQVFLLGILLCIVYGFMLLDNMYNLWPRIGLDYSTHSALAFVLVLLLCKFKRIPVILANVSLVLYFYLMIFLEYHTIEDILSTVIVIYLFYKMLTKRMQYLFLKDN